MATLQAELRTQTGKGVARELRRNNKIPGVVYGASKEPQAITLDRKELRMQTDKFGFLSKVIELKIGNDNVKVLPRDLQKNPVTDKLEHVDFMRVNDKEAVVLDIPVIFTNHQASPGIKRGGNLNIVRHTINFTCMPNAVPEYIEVDLTGKQIGESIHIEEIELPDGVEPTLKRNFTVAAIVGRGAKADAEPTAEAEGEDGEGEDSAEEKSE